VLKSPFVSLAATAPNPVSSAALTRSQTVTHSNATSALAGAAMRNTTSPNPKIRFRVTNTTSVVKESRVAVVDTDADYRQTESVSRIEWIGPQNSVKIGGWP
jgi:hypothetical protein